MPEANAIKGVDTPVVATTAATDVLGQRKIFTPEQQARLGIDEDLHSRLDRRGARPLVHGDKGKLTVGLAVFQTLES